MVSNIRWSTLLYSGTDSVFFWLNADNNEDNKGEGREMTGDGDLTGRYPLGANVWIPVLVVAVVLRKIKND